MTGRPLASASWIDWQKVSSVPVWTNTSLVRLLTTDGAVTGAVLSQDVREVTVKTRQGVVLAAGTTYWIRVGTNSFSSSGTTTSTHICTNTRMSTQMPAYTRTPIRTSIRTRTTMRTTMRTTTFTSAVARRMHTLPA